MSSVGDELPKECARVRAIMAVYRITPNGRFAAAMMEESLKNADIAMVEGDVVKMIIALDDLQKWEL